MIFKVGVFGEAPRTDVTLEGPGAGVDVHVRSEVARRRERFAAQVALVRLVLQNRQTETC